MNNASLSLSELAQFLSLPLSLFIAWITVRLTMQDQRLLMEQQEIVRMINDILDKSRDTKDLTLAHLQGGSGRFDLVSARASKKQILNQIKNIETARLSLDAFLSKKHSDSLMNGLTKWKRNITGERFPVESKDDVCRPGDHPLMMIDDAHLKWECTCQSVKASILKKKNIKPLVI